MKFWEDKQYSRFLEVKKHKVGDDKILFLTSSPEYVDLAPPKPASQFIPAWYKQLQREWTEMRSEEENWDKLPYRDNTLKKCPTVKDIMFSGYIIPLWLDLKISHDKDTGFQWYNKHAYDDTITYHNPASIGSMPIQPSSYHTALKFSNPWDIITPPGWSVIITTPWYHRVWEIEVLPSLVETDSYHQMNIPFLYHGTGEKTYRQGMPLIQVIPYKRESLGMDNYEAREMDEDEQKYYAKSRAAERTRQNGFYRWLTQQNKKRWKDEGIL